MGDEELYEKLTAVKGIGLLLTPPSLHSDHRLWAPSQDTSGWWYTAGLSGALTWDSIHSIKQHVSCNSIRDLFPAGRWSVDMFAMFHCGRLDILPVGDLAVRKGFQALYKLKACICPNAPASVSFNSRCTEKLCRGDFAASCRMQSSFDARFLVLCRQYQQMSRWSTSRRSGAHTDR